MTGGVLTAPRDLSDPKPPPAGTRELTIMVANVLGGGADAGEVAKLIREKRPDLVSLPEAQADVRKDIEAHLQGVSYNGYTQQANTAVESATSVLVSTSLGKVKFDAERLDNSRVSAEQPGTTKPGAGEPGAPTSGPLEQTTTRFGHIIVTGGNLGKLRLIAYHGYPPLPSAVTTWKQDLEVVKGWCAQDQPTIVAGDFNATTDHADFRSALGSNCRSVAPRSGPAWRAPGRRTGRPVPHPDRPRRRIRRDRAGQVQDVRDRGQRPPRRAGHGRRTEVGQDWLAAGR